MQCKTPGDVLRKLRIDRGLTQKAVAGVDTITSLHKNKREGVLHALTHMVMDGLFGVSSCSGSRCRSHWGESAYFT